MCGIIGLLLPNKSHQLPFLLRKALQEIQHRGYDGAGIAVDGSESLQLKKGKGLVKEVLTDNLLYSLPLASYGLAHTRYKTIGECTDNSSQPLLNENKTICLVHNGQIETDHHLPDSTYILQLIEENLSIFENQKLTNEMIHEAIKHVFETIKGAYSCLLMIKGFGLVAFRDPRGIRPLVWACDNSNNWFVSSEDVAMEPLIEEVNDNYLTYLGITEEMSRPVVHSLQPGSCLIIREGGKSAHCQTLIQVKQYTPCIFEYIYLARSKSTLNGLSVENARRELGKLLAKKIKREHPEITESSHLVIPVPATSCLASEVIASSLGYDYVPALKLNPDRKKARTFILPSQEQRQKAVSNKFKLDPNYLGLISGKNVLIVDDSIVRGTTLTYVVQLIKAAGAKEVTVASISPPVKHKNVYGIDIPDAKILLANERTPEQISQKLGVHAVIYQDLDEMVKHFINLTKAEGINGYECSLFNGVY